MRYFSIAFLLVMLFCGSSLFASTPDLQFVTVGVFPNTNVVSGTTSIELSYILKNAGFADAASSVTGFYLSNDQTYSMDDRLLVIQTVNPLAFQQSINLSKYITIPADVVAGNYYVVFYCDINQDVPGETDENNNESFYSISIGGPSGSLPSPGIYPVKNITSTSATFSGVVNPGGLATSTYFLYGTTTSYGSVTLTRQITAGTVAVSVPDETVTGLTPGTLYYVNFSATNSKGEVKSGYVTFTTFTETLPAPTTGTATNITSTGATLNGTVNPGGLATSVFFKYGTTTSYGQTTTTRQITAGTTAVSVPAEALTGLTPNTTYHYQLTATNNKGQELGLDKTFITPPLDVTTLPVPTTGTATNITSTGATLNGTVNPGGLATSVFFKYGTTTSYGQTTTTRQITAGTTAVSVPAEALTGLTPNTTYHYQLTATNNKGQELGLDKTFITPPLDVTTLPVPTTGTATNITSTGATLNGTVNPGGLATSVFFKYGTTTSYGQTTTTRQITAGTTAVSVPAEALTGLTPGTTYHYQLTATNNKGQDVGLDQTFMTSGSTALPFSDGFESGNFIIGDWTVGGDISIVSNPVASGLKAAQGTNTYSLSKYFTAISNGILEVTVKFNVAQTTKNACSIELMSGVDPIVLVFPRHTGDIESYDGPMDNILNSKIIYPSYSANTWYTVRIVVDLLASKFDVYINDIMKVNKFNFALAGKSIDKIVLTSGESAGSIVYIDDILISENNADPTTLPIATTGIATNIGTTTTTLNGTVNPGGLATSVFFKYGTTTSYGQTTTTRQITAGTTAVSVPAEALTGLIPNTTYHYQLTATNNKGQAVGLDQTFKTGGALPVPIALPPTNITPSGATLNGTVNPGGLATSAWFEYGTTTNYGTKTVTQNILAGTTTVNLSPEIISALTSGTYHYRVSATNNLGQAYSPDATFSTVNPGIQYFTPNWDGNPYLAMNIYISSATLDGSNLAAGDEIAVFDGTNCIGTKVLSSTLTSGTPLAIIASTDDPGTPAIDGFTPGHTINYKYWKISSSKEISNVIATYTSGSGVFSSQGTAVADLNANNIQEINLSQGWNIFSSYVSPNNLDLKNIVSSLINSNILIKVQDEAGNAIEKLPVIGWVNNIGNWKPTEGYYIKVNSQALLSIEGAPVPLPISIPLLSGWNIMGYPLQSGKNGLNVVQPLINLNHLIKVQDEKGNAIEKLPVIGWYNGIGSFIPGEGYYVKVNTNTSLDINSSLTTLALESENFNVSKIDVNEQTIQKLQKNGIKNKIQFKSNISTNHFQPVWNGNPYLPMNLYVTKVSVEGDTLNAGDEIGIFDGNVCVGAKIVTSSIDSTSPFALIASADDPSTVEKDGFSSSNVISFKIWKSISSKEIGGIQTQYSLGDGNFSPQGTAVLSLFKAVQSNDTITVRLPNVTSNRGDTIIIPLHVVFPPNLSFGSMDLSIRGFQGKLQFIKIDTVGTLFGQSNWNYEYNNTDSLLIIASAGSKNISGTGSIINLIMRIPSNALIESVPLNISSIKFENGTVKVNVANGTVMIQPLYTPTVIKPANGETGLLKDILFVWNNATGAKKYSLQVAHDSLFNTNLFFNDSTIIDTTKIIRGFDYNSKYWWRLRSENAFEKSNWSSKYFFNTDIVKYGDVSLDDSVNSFDASMVLKYVVNLMPLTEKQKRSANVTLDSTVSALDAKLILKFVSRLISKLPYDTTVNGNLNASGVLAVTDVPILKQATNISIPIFVNGSKKLFSAQGFMRINFQDFELTNIEFAGNYNYKVSGDTLLFAVALSDSIGNIVGNVKVGNFILKAKKDIANNTSVIDILGYKLNEGKIVTGPKIVTNVKLLLEKLIPRVYSLYQNYPNPFNPSTLITFDIPKSSFVYLKIYNALGQEVSTLINDNLQPGSYSQEWKAINMPSGIYFYHIQAGEYSSTKKMLLLK